VSYRISAPAQSPGVVPAVEMDAAAVDAQLKALQTLVAEIGDL
jgi:hypothetical protein